MAEGKITITIAAVDRLTAPVRMMNEAAALLASQFVRLNSVTQAMGGGAAAAVRQISALPRAMVRMGGPRDLGLDDLDTRFKTLRGSVTDVAGRVSALSGSMLNMAGLGGLSLSDVAVGLGRGVVEASAQAEQYEAVLRSLFGSNAKAKESMAWIDTFAEKTPFSVDAVTDAFIRLKAQGIDPTDGTLQAVGDAAAATGKPLAQMVDVMAAAAGGKLDRLRDVAGGRAETKDGKVTYTVADKDGKQRVFTAAENDAQALQAMVMQVFEAKGYTGAMDNLSRTWNAMWLKLQEAGSGFLQMIGDAGTFDYLRDKLRAVLDLINQWKADGTLQAWAKRISDAFTGAMQAIEGKLAGVNWAQEFTTVTDTVSRFVDTVRSVVAWLGGWENAVILVAFVMNAGLLASVLQLGMALGGLAVGFVRVGASMAMMAVGNVVAGIGGVIGGVLAAVKAVDTLIFALRTSGSVFASLSLVMATNPIGMVVLAVAALAGMAYVLWENWETVGPYFNALWQGISDIVLKLTGLNLSEIGTNLINSLWAALKAMTDWLPDWAKDKLGITFPDAPPPPAPPAPPPAAERTSAVAQMATLQVPQPAKPPPPRLPFVAGTLSAGVAMTCGPMTMPAVAQAANPAAGVPAAPAVPGIPPLGPMAVPPVSQISAPVTVAVTVNGMADIDVLRREVEGAIRRAMEEWQWRQQSAAGAALWGGV